MRPGQGKTRRLNYADFGDSGASIWLLLYVGGTLTGLTGLLSLVSILFHEQSNIRIITAVFAPVAFLASIICSSIFICSFGTKYIGSWFAYGIGLFLLFGAFYCDWILAAIAGNWGGLPSSDIAVLYWIYFVSKRLPMLST
jgi:hypothetical protein